MGNDRVAVFIDGANLYKALKYKFTRASVDFGKLAGLLVGERQLLRTYYYNAAYPGSDTRAKDQQKFFDALKKIPYLELRLGKLQPKDGSYEQKGVDVHLAVRMIDLAFRNTYDVAVLISGDSDFVPAVNMVKNLGKHVELAFVEGQPCFELQAACDKKTMLTDALLGPAWIDGRGPA